MSVVLRCPNCGTTGGLPGECEACQEAQVRYFCENHTPGLWLDEPTCRQCGAEFGEPRQRPSAAAPSSGALFNKPGAARTFDRGSAAAPLAMWQKILEAALSARHLPTSPPLYRGRPTMAPVLGGCLKRLAFIILLLFFALVAAGFVLRRALLHGF